MKKNKKKIFTMLMLLLSFLTLTVSQVHAVEYYEFTFDITDVSNTSDIVYTSNYTYQEIVAFMLQHGTLNVDDYEYALTQNEQYIFYNTSADIIIFTYSGSNEVDFALHSDGIMEGGFINNSPTVGIYTFTTFEVESPGIVTGIIDTISMWIVGFWSIILMTINSAVSIFYTLPVGENPGGLTVMGILSLFGLGVGLVLYGIGFVARMFKK